MKTIKLNIIKKNRKYFACKTSNGYNARLVIDENSKDLKLGEQDLPVNDKSKRTKYGTDLIFEIAGNIKEIEEAGIITLSHHLYNSELVHQCRNMGGRWDGEENCWVFSEIVADKVDELDELYNSTLIPIEISIAHDEKGNRDRISEHTGPVDFIGYTIARAYGRDSGAKLGDGISMMQGDIDSGGSVKNWRTIISENSIFRLKVPEKLLEQHMDENGNVGEWAVKKLSGEIEKNENH